jgi:hypothetical protein
MCCITRNIRHGPTVLLYIFIKQRHVQTFWGIIHACQAILETGSGRKLSHNGSTASNFDIPDHGFLLLTCMSARITKYLNKYVRRGLCLIYISSFYFWSPPLARKMRKTMCCITRNRIYSLTVYIYKAETCTNILRYNTCMSSYPGDRKWTKIEP